MADNATPGDLDITDELIAERRAGAPGQTPADMTPWMRPIVAAIDVLNLWVGRFACLLLIPIIFVMVFEVVSRKVFLAPTDFSYEYSRMLAGALFMLGAGYALMRGVHIRADFLYRNWAPERQATVDAALYLAFYFPAMLFFLWVSSEFTLGAWMTWERSMDTAMMAPLAPARTAMPIAALLLLLQGVSELFKSLYEMHAPRRQAFLRFLPVYVSGLALVFASTVFAGTLPVGGWWSSLVDASGLGAIPGEYIGLIMLAVMLFSIFVGFPISFTLIFLAFVFGAWGFSGKMAFYLQTFQFNATMLDDQLVAVPLFVFMGILMEQAGLMERLFRAVQLMFSRTRGALYVAVLFVSTIFAAATGIVGASVTILGIMAAQTMNRSGYNVRLASGTITAGGTLGILIPPSIMLVVMGPVLEVPVTELFVAAIIPGIMLAGLYMLYALGRCWIDRDLGPILPDVEQPKTSEYYFLEFVLVLGSLAVFAGLIYRAATGELAGAFPGASFILPVAWIGLTIAAYRVRPVLFAAIAIGLPIATAVIGWSLLSGVAAWAGGGGIPAGIAVARDGVIFGVLAAALIMAIKITLRQDWESFFISELWEEFYKGLVPPSILVAFALGSIMLGWATPAEAAACGAFGALLMSLAYRKLAVQTFYDALIKTLEITVLIMFLVAASNFFGAVFSRLGTPTMLTELLLAWDLNETLILVIIMALIFLLGWPLEWVPIVLIIVPILIPALDQLGVNLTWFGILVAVNLQTAWLSPPVALSAYFLKGVVPEWDLKDIYIGMMQFMLIQLLGLILIFNFPALALWLPSYIYGQ